MFERRALSPKAEFLDPPILLAKLESPRAVLPFLSSPSERALKPSYPITFMAGGEYGETFLTETSSMVQVLPEL